MYSDGRSQAVANRPKAVIPAIRFRHKRVADGPKRPVPVRKFTKVGASRVRYPQRRPRAFTSHNAAGLNEVL